MKTSRQRLFEYIQVHHVVTVTDLSRALKMTPANARHHLSILIDQGLVEMVGFRPGKGRGRPTQMYSLSAKAQGHNLDRLAGILLDELLSGLGDDERQARIKAISSRLRSDKPGVDRSEPSHLTQRLYQAIAQLNQLNYQARWEAHAEAPRLLLEHCPYAAILPEHPELCRLDAFLIESLVEAPVQQNAKLALDPRGRTYCLFTITRSGRR
jgi:predicted ArsR family transcriptional regulator